VDRGAAPRHQQVDGLVILRLGEPHRFLIEQRARVAEPCTEAREIFQRADAAVDIDRRVRFGVAGIGDGDLFVARAVRGEHVGNGAEQLCPLGVAHGAQAALAVLAGKFQRSL